MKRMTRREFLRAGALASLGAVFLPERLWAEHGGEAQAKDYEVTGWSGNEFEIPHKLRDGWRPPDAEVSETHEVVVVGAGIAGLAAAFQLRHTDLLVLEAARANGGNARAGSWQGNPFNIGSAYFTQPSREQFALLDAAGIKILRVKKPVDRWFLDGAWVPEPWADESMAKQPSDLRRAMEGFKKALRGICAGADSPQNPYQRSSARALGLDRISFSQWLKPFAHPALMPFFTSYCYSALGSSPDTVSAYGGINFYSEILSAIYTTPSGNAHIAQGLARGILSAGAHRIRSDCYVYRISPASGGAAIVRYVRGGRSFTVTAKRVVLAVPYFVASTLLESLADGQRYALKAQQYASYVVANLCFDRKVSFDAYDNWTGGKAIFEDFIPSSWAGGSPPAGGAGGAQVIGVFMPMREALAGRWRLLSATPGEFAAPIVKAFEAMAPGSTRHLKEVHMTRWGHAILMNKVGLFTRWLPSIHKNIGPVVLAHSDGQGLPAVESAMNEGMSAARDVLQAWAR